MYPMRATSRLIDANLYLEGVVLSLFTGNSFVHSALF